MDKLNFVRDGEGKLPPGFRFQPTDEEIVFQYLARKVFSYPLPASIIPELLNIFSFHPWELPGNSEQDRYFFSYNIATNYKNVIKRGSAVGRGGYWKANGADKIIVCSKRIPIVGIRKTLVFYKGKHPHAARTDWTMHLYCIALSRNNTASNIQKKQNSQGSLIQIGNWTLCHIFLKNRNNKLTDDHSSLRNYDSIHTDISAVDSFSASSSSSSCSSSSSDSSALTEVSSSSI